MTTKLQTPVRLYLIRHGETEWSLSGQHTGVTELLLTARGEDEARSLAPRLNSVPFARVFTSPRQRARQTSVLSGHGPAAEIEPALAEWDYGDYEGQRTADIREKREGWNIFRDGCPNGEAPAQVFARADRLIEQLRALNGNVALFTHGHFACVLAARWIGLPLLEAQHFQLGTASLSILGYDHHDVSVIALWNWTAQQPPAAASLLDTGDSVTTEAPANERENDDELATAVAAGPLTINER